MASLKMSMIWGLIALLVSVVCLVSPPQVPMLEEGRLKVTVDKVRGVFDQPGSDYAGYVHFGNETHIKSIYFYIEPSRGNPAEDPVVLWLSGGPGTPSTWALVDQWGTKRFEAKKEGGFHLADNPAVLNERATIIYIDQPGRAGFSLYENYPLPQNSVEASHTIVDLLKALALTDQLAEIFKSSNFHVAGASYAAQFIPTVAKLLVDDPQTPASLKPKSIAIGNGQIDLIVQSQRSVDMMRSVGQHLFTEQEYRAGAHQVQACSQIGQDCLDSGCSSAEWISAYTLCRAWMVRLCSVQKRDMFDWDMTSDNDDWDAYRQNDSGTRERRYAHIERFMEEKTLVMNAKGPWIMQDLAIETGFKEKGGSFRSTVSEISALLDVGVKVLIYAGTSDIACHPLGMRAIINTLRPRDSAFANLESASEYDLFGNGDTIDVEVWARYLSDGLLTYAELESCGHMPTERRPLAVKKMIGLWFDKGRLDG